MKIKVAILFGGQSTEHEVSRVSAASVLRHIDQYKYDVYPIGITKDGQWFEYNGKIDNIENGSWETDEFYKKPEGENILFNKGVDAVFPVLHGAYGEDGTIQGLCKLLNIPCVGPGVMSSAVCMDKVYTKYVLEKFGVKQADYYVVTAANYANDKDTIVSAIEEKLGYNLFIKPANSGSSVGITKAHDREELIKGIEEALKHDRKVLVEEALIAREIEVSVLGNDAPEASLPGEIIPAKEFYDYEAKYQNENSLLLIPANLPEDELEGIREKAVNIYKNLDCAGMARVDFLVDKDTREVYLNEVNTIPGFTSISMYSKMWESTGKPYTQLIDELIQLALERKNG
ncbi:D-alanine--D-alanine ligase [Clostridium collagenovorans DSM 3089]|uniref:D-alanine--D-alanine ligase n=1 Tax=Clostridium collagenovorans DSM 3089 TaxID=1121306 RepID=A0A1M5W3N1_9CLOT|nr:D-alanine--D-alanine ligase family protein [Clostridium collagenovorans]SHH82060.1 D-alanine--D-alanine ligase [Clostridium collagenovorans DSM 3089]